MSRKRRAQNNSDLKFYRDIIGLKFYSGQVMSLGCEDISSIQKSQIRSNTSKFKNNNKKKKTDEKILRQ
jgi:hypothetical protein